MHYSGGVPHTSSSLSISAAGGGSGSNNESSSGAGQQPRQPHGDGAGPPPPAGTLPPEKKKKRLTQACQHCRKKKIKCDGIRPSCKNCAKGSIPCTYLPSIRKRGRNGMRIPAIPPFAAAGPYDRPMQTQAMSLAGHLMPGSALAHHQQHPAQFQHQQPTFQINQQQHHHHHNPHNIPPPPQPMPPPSTQLQINPLGPSFLSSGPASLHLKRDPGFGQDPMEEAMYDPAKQAYDMSTHFMLPINSFHFQPFTPQRQTPLGAQPGPSSRNGGYGGGQSSSSGNTRNPASLGIPGNPQSHRTPSGSSFVHGFGPYDSGGPSGSAMAASQGKAQPASIPSNFDPTMLAQDLSSAYASVIAGVPPHGPQQLQQQQQPAHLSQPPPINTALSGTPKSANALGKSASHTPITALAESGAADVRATTQLRDLRKQIRDIISSVWADTACGRSSGMAGITMADDEPGSNDDHGSSHGSSPAGTPHNAAKQERSASSAVLGSANAAGATPLDMPSPLPTSPSGDRSMDDHLINIFFEYVYHQLPIISRAEFYRLYTANRASPLLVCAMCAAASVFLNRIEDERKAIYETYAQKVREQFHDACFKPSLDVVQTALIMTLCEYRHGSLHRAWVYLSMGFRLAIAMGYHHHDIKIRAGPMESSRDIVHSEACRRAFWGAFLLDRYTAIGGGKALGINDDDIAVLLPLRDEDWQAPDSAPPVSVLEFFKPASLLPPKNPSMSVACSHSASTASANSMAVCSASSGPNAKSSSSISNVSASVAGATANTGSTSSTAPVGSDADTRLNIGSAGSSRSSSASDDAAGTRNGTPAAGSGSGWDGKAGELGALGHFIKLMAVVGQVAQHINGAKSSGSTGVSDRPSSAYAALDAALLHWKEELPPHLSYSEAKCIDTEPELAVLVSCMHAIYYGAVIMLNRENMGLLRDLPGQLDVSTNLAIRSLERCRVAAMEVVEIAHHICSLPSAKTNALLPWALFQAGTLLIHFMIAGSTPQAQEEARSAILSLDCALRDELSRYWAVSSKYHLVLSNMVKAWERTRQSTPVLPPSQAKQQQQQTQAQAQAGKAPSSEPAGDISLSLSTNIPLPMQMQMHMQLPVQMPVQMGMQNHAQQQQQQQQQAEPISTLLKPYAVPGAGGMADTNAHASMLQIAQQQSRLQVLDGSHQQQQQQQHQHQHQHQQLSVPNSTMPRNPNRTPSFMFTPDTAQDSMNTLNAFLSQLSAEQALQFAEGLQTYSLQGSRGGFAGGRLGQINAATSGIMSSGLGNDPLLAPAPGPAQPNMLLPGAAAQRAQHAQLDIVSQDRLQSRRGSIPIASSGDLFTAPGVPTFSTSAFSQSSAAASLQVGGEAGISELDPLLFNPMTPFLQELQLFNTPALQQQSSSAGAGESGKQPSRAANESNAQPHC